MCKAKIPDDAWKCNYVTRKATRPQRHNFVPLPPTRSRLFAPPHHRFIIPSNIFYLLLSPSHPFLSTRPIHLSSAYRRQDTAQAGIKTRNTFHQTRQHAVTCPITPANQIAPTNIVGLLGDEEKTGGSHSSFYAADVAKNDSA
jgi:hypothetical protein